MIISRIQTTKKQRQALFDEDDNFLFSIDDETMHRHKIKEGTRLNEQQLESLKANSDMRKAKDKALQYVSLRAHCTGELYKKLCTKFDDETSAFAVSEMVRLNLIDDEKYALAKAKYLAGQNKSSREIVRRLTLKGVSRDMAQFAVESLENTDDDACYNVVKKSYMSKLMQGKKQNVFAALIRRGFSYSEAKQALEKIEEELEFDIL